MNDIAFSVLVGNGFDDIIFKTIMLKGDKGNSIASIEKTSTSGKVDTYTIYLTDGTVGGTFTVTNGEDGAPVNIDDTVTALDKTWSSSKLSGMIKEIDDSDVDSDKLWSSEKINSLIPQTDTIEDVAVASFSDGADNVPVSSLIVDIEAYQAGTEDASPSNVRAISGWNACNITKCGKNLFDDNIYTECGWTLQENGYYNGNAWALLKNSRYAYVNGGIKTEGVVTVSFDLLRTSGAMQIYCLYEGDDAWTNLSGNIQSEGHKTLTTASGRNCIAVGLSTTVGVSSQAFSLKNFQIECSPSETTYEDFDGGIDTIDLTQTIYGGTLNVSTGLLTVTHKINELDENSGWTKATAGNVFFLDNFFEIDKGDGTTMCNMYLRSNSKATVSGVLDNPDKTFCGCTTSANYKRLFIKDTTYSTIEDWLAFVALNHIQIVQPLATPTTIQLTPTEVKTMAGINNIFADTGDINELVYFKAGSEAVAKLIEAYMRS